MDSFGISERERIKNRSEKAGAKRTGRQVSRTSVHLAPLPPEVRRSASNFQNIKAVQEPEVKSRPERLSYSKGDSQEKRGGQLGRPPNGLKLQPMPQNPFEVSKPTEKTHLDSSTKSVLPKKVEPRNRRVSLVRQQAYSASIDGGSHKDYVRLANLEHVTKRDIKTLQDVYDTIDIDKNGFLSVTEIEREFISPQRVNDTEEDQERHSRKITMMNKMIDTIGSRDQGLTFREMLKLNYPNATVKEVSKMLELVGISKDSEEDTEIRKKLKKEADETWIKCDEFRTGEMEKRNLRDCLRVLGVHDFDNFEAKFIKMDERSDNVVSKGQFISWWIACDFPGYRSKKEYDEDD